MIHLKKLFIIIFNYAIMLASCNNHYPTDISSAAFKAEITNNSNIQIIDVRTLQEFNNGNIPNALNIDWLNQGEFIQEIKKIDPQKSTYIYCQKGSRSGQAAKYLLQKGFTKVFTLQGGIENYDLSK